MKKLIAVLLIAVLLVGLSLPGALAAGGPTVSLSSGQVSAGDSVMLTVSVKNNPGLATALIYIYFDTSVFTVDPASDLYAAGEFGKTGGLLGNTIELAKENGRYSGDAGKDGVLAFWYNRSGIDTNGDGDMLDIRLTAKKNAPNGTYSIGLGYAAGDTRNKSGTVKLTLSGGTVTVVGGRESGGAIQPEPEPEETVPELPDVDGHWAEAEIRESAKLGLINGFEDGTYRPDETMTRAQCVTILWRASGCPKPKSTAAFTDLDPIQQWYWDAVAWATESGVIQGYGDGRFGPSDPVTRAQLLTILHRMAGTPIGMEQMFIPQYDASHPDIGQAADWAKNAVYWAIYKDICCGEASVDLKQGDELKPAANATRAQIAVMMVRYLDKYEGGAEE